MNISKISYQPNMINNQNKQYQSVSFKAGEGQAFVKLLEENKSNFPAEQLDRFIKEKFYILTSRSSIKNLLEESTKYIAGLAASIASLTAVKTSLENANQSLQSENAQLKQTLSDERKRLADENTALKTMLQLEKSDDILSKYSANDVLGLINVFQQLNINVNEGEIRQILDNGITVNDILKFYNLFNGENKEVRDELANTFIKEWILDGVTYDDLDKFLNLPYCQDFADSGEASVFTTDDYKRHAKGVNAKLLTKHFNISDMIYLSESKNLNLQYIHVIMDLINTKQIKLEDIKNMDKDELRKFCNQFDKSRGSDLWQLEEDLFRFCPDDVNWGSILSNKKYNEEHSSSSMPIREIVSENPAFAGDPEMQRLINALLG